MEHNTQFLETEPVGRLMHRYAIPCVISLLVGALYNICLLYTSDAADE